MADISNKELQYLVTEMCRGLINEITVVDAYNKFYNSLNSQDFNTIVTKLQGDNEILLPETKWALELYRRKSPRFMEDLYKLHNDEGTGYLDVFKRAKERRMIKGNEGDLNQYKSIADLGRFVSELNQEEILGKTKGEISNAVNSAKDNVKVIYEDSRWLILIPLSYEASCYWGNGTEWCTATRETDDFYKSYSEQGNLYININKKTGHKYQFHFETDSFMDQWDVPIDKPVFENADETGLLDIIYSKILDKEDYLSGKYNVVNHDDENGKPKMRYSSFEENEDDEKICYLLDENGKAIAGPFQQIFTFYSSYYHGEQAKKYARVLNQDRLCNLLDLDGNLLLKTWHDDIKWVDDKGRYVATEKNKKIPYVDYLDKELYLFDKDGNKIVKNGLTRILPFKFGYAVIEKSNLNYNDLYNYIDEQGNVVFDEWMYHCSTFTYEGWATVKNTRNQYNVFGKEGSLRLPEWANEMRLVPYNKLKSFNLYLMIISEDGKYNYVTTDGYLFSKIWFDKPLEEWQTLKNECYQVWVNGKLMLVDKEGNVKPDFKTNVQENLNKLTEEERSFVVREMTERLINEISVKDAYDRFYSNISQEDYKKIVSEIQGDNDILLPETKWALGLYKKTRFNLNRLPQLADLLRLFKRAKERQLISGRDGDLGRYHSFEDLEDYIHKNIGVDRINVPTHREFNKAINNAKDDVDIKYEDDEWLILAPLSYEASCYWGKGTAWCTSTRETQEHFDDYNSQGKLYININKQTGEKYQFHFETLSFMDATDDRVENPVLDTMGMSDGAKEFYSELCSPWNYWMLNSSKVKRLGNGYNSYCYAFYTNEGIMILDSDYEDILLSNVEDIEQFVPNDPDLYKITLKNLQQTIFNVYDKDTTIYETYDEIEDPYNGFSVVWKRDNANYLNIETWELLSEEWFGDCDAFKNGKALVYRNGKQNYIYEDGTYLSDDWYDEIELIDNWFYHVRQGEYYNLLNYNGVPIFNQWFDNIYTNTIVITNETNAILVAKNKKYNFFNIITGKPCFENWFDGVSRNGRKWTVRIGNSAYDVNVDNGEIIRNAAMSGDNYKRPE